MTIQQQSLRVYYCDQVSSRKVLHLSTCLVIVITLVSLTSCDVMGLSKSWHHVWSALGLSPTMVPPPYFLYICLSVIPFSIYFGCWYTVFPSKVHRYSLRCFWPAQHFSNSTRNLSMNVPRIFHFFLSLSFRFYLPNPPLVISKKLPIENFKQKWFFEPLTNLSCVKALTTVPSVLCRKSRISRSSRGSKLNCFT